MLTRGDTAYLEKSNEVIAHITVTAIKGQENEELCY